jgi:hypothetical protein
MIKYNLYNVVSCVNWKLLIYICCALVGLDNKLYKMHGSYIEKVSKVFTVFVL